MDPKWTKRFHKLTTRRIDVGGKKGSSVPKAQKKPKPDTVSVSSKLREANPWFEEGARPKKDEALKEKKEDLKKKGKTLSEQFPSRALRASGRREMGERPEGSSWLAKLLAWS
jgi:hypothetical protein